MTSFFLSLHSHWAEERFSLHCAPLPWCFLYCLFIAGVLSLTFHGLPFSIEWFNFFLVSWKLLLNTHVAYGLCRRPLSDVWRLVFFSCRVSSLTQLNLMSFPWNLCLREPSSLSNIRNMLALPFKFHDSKFCVLNCFPFKWSWRSLRIRHIWESRLSTHILLRELRVPLLGCVDVWVINWDLCTLK